MTNQSFRQINADLIQAKKEVKEQARLLDLLATMDVELSNAKAALSLAVTELKWKQHDLDNAKRGSVAGLFQRLRGQHKAWQAERQAVYETAVFHHDEAKARLNMLEKQQAELTNLLNYFAHAHDHLATVRQQQLNYALGNLASTKKQLLYSLTTDVKRLADTRQALESPVTVGRRLLEQMAELVTAVLVWVEITIFLPVRQFN